MHDKTKNVNRRRDSPIFVHRKFDERFGSDFEVYFRDILPMLKSYYWVVEEDTFYAPVDWICPPRGKFSDNDEENEDPRVFELNTFIEKNERYCLCDTNFISKFCGCVRDAWNTLYCFDNKKISFQEFTGYILGDHKDILDFIKKNIEILFYNFDGLFWEVHSSKDEYLEPVNNLKREYEGLHITELDTMTLEGIF